MCHSSFFSAPAGKGVKEAMGPVTVARQVIPSTRNAMSLGFRRPLILAHERHPRFMFTAQELNVFVMIMNQLELGGLITRSSLSVQIATFNTIGIPTSMVEELYLMHLAAFRVLHRVEMAAGSTKM